MGMGSEPERYLVLGGVRLPAARRRAGGRGSRPAPGRHLCAIVVGPPPGKSRFPGGHSSAPHRGRRVGRGLSLSAPIAGPSPASACYFFFLAVSGRGSATKPSRLGILTS